MSYQAMGWAIDQEVESPSARCVLMSIANYANEEWCAWPKQDLIAKEGVQSVDSVQRRMPDLIGRGLVRRIKLKRFGRRTHDFYILNRSPWFEAPLEAIRPLLPSGCDVIEDNEATANCGSVQNDEITTQPNDSEIDATADCGGSESATLPQSAVDATALVRQQNEPVKNRKNPPNPPSGGGWSRDEDFERDVAEAQRSYPDPITDLPKFRAAFVALDAPARRRVLTAMKGYASYIADCHRKGKARGVKDAHRWVVSGMWEGYVPKGESAEAAALAAYVDHDSREGRALSLLHRIAGLTEPPKVGGKFLLKRPLSARSLAFAEAPDESEWCFIPEAAVNQVGAYRSLFRDELDKPIGALIRDRSWRKRSGAEIEAERRRAPHVAPRQSEAILERGFLAPWPYPPSKEGKIYTTGPPDGLMTADDMATDL